jgi:hypothetical protein
MTNTGVKRKHRQRGITFLGALTVLFLIGFFTMLIIKIGPLYMEHAKVRSALESIKSQPDLASKSRDDLVNMFENRLYINYVEGIGRKNMLITKNGGRTRIEVTYDRSVNIFGNLDVVTHFNDIIEAGSN